MVLLQEQSRIDNMHISFSTIRHVGSGKYNYIYIRMYIVSNKCDKWVISRTIQSFPYEKSLDILD